MTKQQFDALTEQKLKYYTNLPISKFCKETGYHNYINYFQEYDCCAESEAFMLGAEVAWDLLSGEVEKSKALLEEKQNEYFEQCEVIRQLRAENDKLRHALDFYAKHHHHLNTTAPNFAAEALKKGSEE